jgi:hypothetical protein
LAGPVVTGHYEQDRPEMHNSSVDEEVAAELGLCGQVHLQTGRTCLRERHHSGSCEFVPRDEVQESLDTYRSQHHP